MPFGFTHMSFAWLLVKIYSYFKKLKIEIIEWFFLIFGAIFPDSDYLIQWVTGIPVHRLFTHSLLMVILGFLLVYILITVYNKCYDKNLNVKKISILFSIGILSHLILDMLVGKPGVPLFWPLDKWFYFFGILTEPFRSRPYSERTVEMLANALKWAIFDIGLGAAWLFYFIFKKKLVDM